MLYLLLLFLAPGLFIVFCIMYFMALCKIATALHVQDAQYPYAYKLLKWNHRTQLWQSPLAGFDEHCWRDDHLTASVVPTPDNESGIYCCRSYWEWELHFWRLRGGRIFLVKMSEPVMEHEKCYRALDARIVRKMV